MNRPGPSGFTLVELLVVMAIMALAMALTVSNLGTFDREAAVRAGAEALAGTLRQARMLAITSGSPHAVVFNIQNAPGSKGNVLNNRSGGHWYRIMGPAKFAWGRELNNRLLLPYPKDGVFAKNPGRPTLFTLPHYIEALKECWVGPPIPLPGKKVRFLALSETDEGNRINASNQDWSGPYERAYAYAPTYPRPYFGYYDPTTKRLFPWGGYDHALGVAQPWTRIGNQGNQPITNYTGFFYEGKDDNGGQGIVGCVNPTDRIYNVDWDGNDTISGSDSTRGPEVGYHVFTKDEPRPLVNADWADAMIAFLPNGDAFAPPFGVARKRYRCVQATSGWTVAEGNGVSDMTRPWTYRKGMAPGAYPTASNNWAYNYSSNPGNEEWDEQSEFGYFKEHLGGYNISLAPDVLDDNDTFPTAKEALRSMAPIFRVFVSRRGLVDVVRVNIREDAWLEGKNVFPSDPSFFLAANATDAALMGKQYRYGWLHRDRPKSGAWWAVKYEGTPQALSTDGPDDCIPLGQPLSYDLCPRMLSGKIWWLLP